MRRDSDYLGDINLRTSQLNAACRLINKSETLQGHNFEVSFNGLKIDVMGLFFQIYSVKN